MSTQVILLERVEKLGKMGDVVSVKPGFARNYLLPQGKALRASKDNIAYFEAQKKSLEAESDKRKAEAEKLAKKLAGMKVPLIRQASEAGQLYGSVTSRDIATVVSETSKETIERSMVDLNQNFKAIGLFPVEIILHPEVKAEVIVNIARSPEEAETQAKTGQALVTGETQEEEQAKVETPAEEALKDVLEEGALEAEKEKQAEAAQKAAEDAAKEEERKAKAAAKAAEKAAEEEAAAAAAEAEGAEEASEETSEETSEEEAAEEEADKE